MRFFAWNCRGLCQPKAVRALRMLLHSYHPSCIFLSELKISSLSKVSKILVSVGFPHFEFVPAQSSVGGLVLAWKSPTDIQIIFSNTNMINCIILPPAPSSLWQLTAVYGLTVYSKKHGFWQALKRIGEAFNGPWTVVGDFNNILSQVDKRGGSFFASSSSGGF